MRRKQFRWCRECDYYGFGRWHFNECYLPVRRYRYHGSGSGACYEQTDCCDDHGYYFWVYVLLQFWSWSCIPDPDSDSRRTGFNAGSRCHRTGIGDCNRGTIVGFTPISTTGALIMAGVSQQENAEERFPQNRMFVELFAVSFLALAVVAVFSFLGIYHLFV